jgi:hypothetical protein
MGRERQRGLSFRIGGYLRMDSIRYHSPHSDGS